MNPNLGLQFEHFVKEAPSEEEGHTDKYGEVHGVLGGQRIGSVRWSDRTGDPVIEHVDVSEEHQRKGIATSIYEEALRHEPGLLHGDTFTESGLAWARRTGGPAAANRVAVMEGGELLRKERF